MLDAASKSHTDSAMKAIIMAGGAGTRGMPYTQNIPKSMTRIEGRPIIEHITRHIAASRNIDGIIIIADFKGMGGQVRNYLEDVRLCCPITFVQDSGSGTGGDLVHAQRKVGRESFLLWFSDNLCAIDIDAMIATHKTTRRRACVAVSSRRKEETGFIKADGNLVTEFIEKPTITLSMPECLGVYVLDYAILQDIAHQGSRKVDLSHDILGPLAASMKMSAYDIGRADWLDVESPVILERNAARVRRIMIQMKRRASQMRAGRGSSHKL